MLSKKEKRDLKLVGVKTFINPKTGEKVTVDMDETPVFTWEECEKYKIGQPGMKSFSEMTEEERKVFIEKDE